MSFWQDFLATVVLQRLDDEDLDCAARAIKPIWIGKVPRPPGTIQRGREKREIEEINNVRGNGDINSQINALKTRLDHYNVQYDKKTINMNKGNLWALFHQLPPRSFLTAVKDMTSACLHHDVTYCGNGNFEFDAPSMPYTVEVQEDQHFPNQQHNVYITVRPGPITFYVETNKTILDRVATFQTIVETIASPDCAVLRPCSDNQLATFIYAHPLFHK